MTATCETYCNETLPGSYLAPISEKETDDNGSFNFSFSEEQNTTQQMSLNSIKLVDSSKLEDRLKGGVTCTIGDYPLSAVPDPDNRLSKPRGEIKADSFKFPTFPVLSTSGANSTLSCNVTLSAKTEHNIYDVCICLGFNETDTSTSSTLSTPSATQPENPPTTTAGISPNTTTSTSKRKRDGEIAGGVIGGVVLLLVMFVLWRRYHKSRETLILHREKTMERRTTRQSSLWSFLPPTPSMLAEAAKFDPTRMVKTGSPFDKKAFLANNPVGEVRSLLPQP